MQAGASWAIVGYAVFRVGAEGLPFLQSATFGAIEGILGGASPGVTLGYKENRRLAETRGPRVT